MVTNPINKKKSVVKHRTRSGFQPNNHSSNKGDGNLKGKGKGGFKVGPSHAPDGAYLGKAKKLKADLIEKAKIKKKYFKEKAKAESENQSDSIFSERDEGRFAPEEGIGGQDGFDLVEAEKASQRRRRKEGQESSEGGNSMSKRKQAKAEAARAAELESRRRLLGGVMHADRDEKGQAVPEQRTFDKSKEMETSEQRKEERQKRQDKWNSKSGSRTGRQRGQPNLGARMDLLLDKIKKG